MRALVGLLICLLLGCVLRAEEGELDRKFAQLPPGLPLVPPGGIEAFRLGGSGGALTIVDVQGHSFKKAARVETRVKPEQIYGLQISTRTVAPISKGDSLLAVFWARAVDPIPAEGEARTALVVELSQAPHTKSTDFTVALTPEWQKFYRPIKAARNHAPGTANVIFRAGYEPQVIEIADFSLLQYGTSVPMESLPFSVQSYSGRDPKAPWRAAAAARIDKLRKVDIEVVVTRSGKPVPDVEIHVTQQRHAFGWGSAIDAKRILAEGADADQYRKVITENFNKVVIENHMKWPVWEKDRQTATKAVGWLRDHGLQVRGHCIVWPGWKNLPGGLKSLAGDPAKLREAVHTHVRDIAGAMKGQLVDWDVINEPFTNTDLQKELGEEILSECFRIAHEVDPIARLYINDYSILSSGGRDYAHQDHYEKTIRTLLESGAPLQGIGLQGHFGEDLTAPERMLKILDRFGAYGIPIQITEFDVNVWDEQLQADFTRDMLTVAFSHPSVVGVLTWGFWESAHWIPGAAYYTKDWQLRPAGKVWQDLVRREWWTDTRAKTGPDGRATVRAFAGDHRVKVAEGGTTKAEVVVVANKRERVEVSLD